MDDWHRRLSSAEPNVPTADPEIESLNPNPNPKTQPNPNPI